MPLPKLALVVAALVASTSLTSAQGGGAGGAGAASSGAAATGAPSSATGTSTPSGASATNPSGGNASNTNIGPQTTGTANPNNAVSGIGVKDRSNAQTGAVNSSGQPMTPSQEQAARNAGVGHAPDGQPIGSPGTGTSNEDQKGR